MWLAVFESVFAILYLWLSSMLIAGPLFLAHAMNEKSSEDDLKNLWVSAITSIGSLAGGKLILSGVDFTIGYLNDYNAEAESGDD